MNIDNSDIRDFLKRLWPAWSDDELDLMVDRSRVYLDLILEWNEYASLVSKRDADEGLIPHLLDSWSVGIHIPAALDTLKGVRYLDIGSGGGFPAIPICIILPFERVTLIERNGKKCEVLKRVVRKLGLENVEVLNESFEGDLGPGRKVITSRAIEKPLEVIPRIIGTLKPGDFYFCQSPVIEEVELPDGAWCNLVADDYEEEGIRRSVLHIVQV